MTARRVLFLTTGLQGGGAEAMLVHLLRGLDRSRFSPTVVSLLEEGRLRSVVEGLDVPVRSLGLAPGQLPLLAPMRLARMVLHERPEIIQGWMYHGNLAAQCLAPIVRVPVLWCVQNSFHTFAAEKPLTRLTIRSLALVSRFAARIVYVSQVSRAQHERLGFAAAEGIVIPNGADVDRFRPSTEARASLRRELGVPSDTPLIGLIARYHPQKDHATFLRAAELLMAQEPRVHFVLVGAGVDRANVDLAMHPAIESGRVHLLGERADVAGLSAAFDVGTSSSSYGEGLSLAVAESMACEVPCVVTDVGDSGHLVGETGIVVPPQRPDDLAAGWRAALRRRSELGPRARARIVERFSVTAIVRRYEQLYEARRGGTNSPSGD